MKDNEQTRDIGGALVHLTGILLLLSSFNPFRLHLLLLGCVSFVVGYFIAARKWVALAAALILFSLRSLWVLIFVSRDIRVVLMMVGSAAASYAIYRIDPKCSEVRGQRRP